MCVGGGREEVKYRQMIHGKLIDLLYKFSKVWHQVHIYVGTVHLEIKQEKEEGKGKEGSGKGEGQCYGL